VYAPIPTFDETLSRLYARIPLGMRLGLDPMREACAHTGHPEQAFPAVHIAGTNGKGSVSAMVEAIARAHGLRTGLYTSPHLCRFAERIRIDGEPVDDAVLGSMLERALSAGPDLSFFETATLAAFLAFREAHVDLAVLEVGIGGRLDATNVIPPPRAAAITRIALDHMDRLGQTLVEIAREKAGIAKAGVEIVLGPVAPPVRAAIDEVARANGARTVSVDEAPLPARVGLAGAHQSENARVAAALGARIGASATSIEHGIAGVRWPGRLERIGDFLLDGAHNPDGAEALARHLRSLSIPPERVALVFGTLGDKDWTAMLDTLAPLAEARLYVAPPASRSAVDPRAMSSRHPGLVAASIEEAVQRAQLGQLGQPGRRSQRGSALCVICGSLIVVGQARALLLGLPRDPPVAL
jgi:dihydrofolate synthase/folylpolyglutamate synthase